MKQNSTKHPTPSAVIDIGSNTLRLLIGYIYDGVLIRLATERSVTRLGKGVSATGKLSDESVCKSIQSLLKFKDIIDKYKITDIIAIGTSALRDASNRDNFIAKVKSISGIKIDIISGDMEAELTRKGILGQIEKNDINIFGPSTIIDIGGGSTEWIVCNGKCIKGSMSLGAVKLYETYIKHDPPVLDEIEKIKTYILQQVVNAGLMVGAEGLKGRFIATGGTATTLAAIDMKLDEYNSDKIHQHRISLPALNSICKKLSALSHDERGLVKGMGTERADIIIPGILILTAIMGMLGFGEVIISDHGLLEGVLIDHPSAM